MIGIEEIEAARERIASHIRRTPAMALTATKEALPFAGAVTLKVESLQVTGSFKARGAMNRLLGAPAGEVANGIVTASGGNHGLAVARTAFVAVSAIVGVRRMWGAMRSRAASMSSMPIMPSRPRSGTPR